jgi:hypothetical protein
MDLPGRPETAAGLSSGHISSSGTKTQLSSDLMDCPGVGWSVTVSPPWYAHGCQETDVEFQAIPLSLHHRAEGSRSSSGTWSTRSRCRTCATNSGCSHPQSNGKLERYHKTIKSDAIRPGQPSSLDEARALVARLVEHYNTVRLHSAIGYSDVDQTPSSRAIEPARVRRPHRLIATGCARERASLPHLTWAHGIGHR